MLQSGESSGLSGGNSWAYIEFSFCSCIVIFVVYMSQFLDKKMLLKSTIYDVSLLASKHDIEFQHLVLSLRLRSVDVLEFLGEVLIRQIIVEMG